MEKDIVLDTFPKEAGVYMFKADDEVIYIGSSKNLYQRMKEHRSCIRKGSKDGYKQDLYKYLQSNTFVVEFQIADNYKQLEQQFIEQYHPKYNAIRANTGLGARKGREAEYNKEYNKKYKEEISKQAKQRYEANKEEILEQVKQYYESNKEQKKQYNKQYYNQLCCFNGQTLTLSALSMRFMRRGIDHPTLEAKKYLIKD